MKASLYGWVLLSTSAAIGGAIVFLAFFFGIRIGESGARKTLEAIMATVDRGLPIRTEDGRTQWIAPPYDSVRRRYIPKRAIPQ